MRTPDDVLLQVESLCVHVCVHACVCVHIYVKVQRFSLCCVEFFVALLGSVKSLVQGMIYSLDINELCLSLSFTSPLCPSPPSGCCCCSSVPPPFSSCSSRFNLGGRGGPPNPDSHVPLPPCCSACWSPGGRMGMLSIDHSAASSASCRSSAAHAHLSSAAELLGGTAAAPEAGERPSLACTAASELSVGAVPCSARLAARSAIGARSAAGMLKFRCGSTPRRRSRALLDGGGKQA
jgi:hypothetical protein